MARCRLAAKLHPDSAWGQVRLASALIKADELVRPRKALKLAQQLEPGTLGHLYLPGIACGQDRRPRRRGGRFAQGAGGQSEAWPHAISCWRWVLGKQGKLEEARDEYRTALLYDSLFSSEDKATCCAPSPKSTRSSRASEFGLRE